MSHHARRQAVPRPVLSRLSGIMFAILTYNLTPATVWPDWVTGGYTEARQVDPLSLGARTIEVRWDRQSYMYDVGWGKFRVVEVYRVGAHINMRPYDKSGLNEYRGTIWPATANQKKLYREIFG